MAIRWLKKDNDKYKRIFPEGLEVEIILEGKNIGRKKADWSMKRIYIGKKLLEEKYNDGDIISIAREGDKVYITKGEKLIDLPLIDELRQNQRKSDDPSLFEKSIVKAFKKLGFTDAEHLGGRDEPDVVIKSFKVVIDAKTTKEGVITERYINFDAMERYKEKYNAIYVGVIAPGFSEGYIRRTAKNKGIVLIETEAICELLQNHAIYPYKPKRIVEVLFRSDKGVITRKDIPSSTIDKEKLINIVANTLQVLKNFEKAKIHRFSGNDLHKALVGRGLNYGVDEVEDGLKFLSTYPINILQIQDDKYFPTANIDLILSKIGLLIQAFKRMKEVE